MQETFPVELLAGFERQLVTCLQAVHRVPLDVRSWEQWRTVEHELIRATRCLVELRRMAAWLRVGLPFGASNVGRTVAAKRSCESAE